MENLLHTVLVVWLLFGLIVADVNKRKTGGWLCGFALGVCLGPIGLLLSLVIPYRPQQESSTERIIAQFADTIRARRVARRSWLTTQGMMSRSDSSRLGMAVAIVFAVVGVIVAFAVAV